MTPHRVQPSAIKAAPFRQLAEVDRFFCRRILRPRQF
jgi:hypothetical protein